MNSGITNANESSSSSSSKIAGGIVNKNDNSQYQDKISIITCSIWIEMRTIKTNLLEYFQNIFIE